MQITLHRQFPLEMQADWDALLRNSPADVPFLRFDYLRRWWETRGGGEWQQAELNILTGSNGHSLAGIAPFFRTNDPGQVCLMFLGSVEVFDYLDFIAREEDLADFLESVLSFVKEMAEPCDTIDLYNIIDGSPTLALLQTAAQRASWSLQLEQLQPSPYVPLAGDWEAYLAGIDKKQRHEIRRKLRRFEELGPNTRWYIVEDRQALHPEMDQFLDMMAQDADKQVFLTLHMREFMHGIAQTAFDTGLLQLSFLEIDGRKAAGKFLLNYRERLWAYNSAVEGHFREHSPGWVLLSYILQWASQNGIREFDFMRGNEEYKYRFGARDRYVMRATLTKI